MAEQELKGDEAPKKSKMMLIIIIVVVLLAGGGGAAYFFLFMGDEPVAEETEAGEGDGGAGAGEAPAEGAAIYVGMPRPFQFNAPGTSRERIVQIEVQLMVRGQENEELAKRHIPMIEGNLLQVFSAANADDLVTDVGKTELRDKATSQVRQTMTGLEKKPVVEQVLFTGFVIQ
jgi:flagellar FliL protein